MGFLGGTLASKYSRGCSRGWVVPVEVPVPLCSCVSQHWTPREASQLQQAAASSCIFCGRDNRAVLCVQSWVCGQLAWRAYPHSTLTAAVHAALHLWQTSLFRGSICMVQQSGGSFKLEVTFPSTAFLMLNSIKGFSASVGHHQFHHTLPHLTSLAMLGSSGPSSLMSYKTVCMRRWTALSWLLTTRYLHVWCVAAFPAGDHPLLPF